MASARLTRLFIEAMAKHLPPSASTLRLVDLDGKAGAILHSLREDLEVIASSPHDLPAESVDAVIAYDHPLADDLLTGALSALRPGGRLIVVNTAGEVNERDGQTLEGAGYTRIMVEVGIECPTPLGVLMRGEKPHQTADTLARIQGVAMEDHDALTLGDYRGRYVYLLITQTPNKPVWALRPDEPIAWQAVTVDDTLLAFSSLPKAVGFMQPAVIANKIRDVNKVAKFRKEVAQAWPQRVILNPSLELLVGRKTSLIPIDPTTAEKPDE
ncbi:MAG: hypothetical protein MUF87_13770 [Anaerolineae bacterium]|jgi:hypothetical protein|nr:hypothetical protein [Anaerolineae bacterium]